MAQKKKSTSGGGRMMEKGKRPMLLGWLPADRATIEAAAHADGRPMTQFVYHHALKAAEVILKKKEK